MFSIGFEKIPVPKSYIKYPPGREFSKEYKQGYLDAIYDVEDIFRSSNKGNKLKSKLLYELYKRFALKR